MCSDAPVPYVRLSPKQMIFSPLGEVFFISGVQERKKMLKNRIQMRMIRFILKAIIGRVQTVGFIKAINTA